MAPLKPAPSTPRPNVTPSGQPVPPQKTAIQLLDEYEIRLIERSKRVKHTCGIDGDPGAVTPLNGTCRACEIKKLKDRIATLVQEEARSINPTIETQTRDLQL